MPGGRVLRGDNSVLLREHRALHEIAARLRHEGVSAAGRQGGPAVNERSAGSRRGAERAVGTQGLRFVAAIHARRRMRGPDGLVLHHLHVDAGLSAQQRVPRVGLRRQEIAAQKVGVVIEVEPARIVLTKPVLPAAQPAVLRPHAGAQAQARAPAGGPDIIIDRPHRRVRHVLRLTGAAAKILSHHFLHIGHAVAVGVLAEEQLRRDRDQRSAIHRHHRTRQNQRIHKHSRLVHAPVAIAVRQQFHPAQRLQVLRARHVVHVTAHLHHVEPTLIVPAQGDGGFHQRLRGDEFDAVALLDGEGLRRLLRRERRGRREIEFDLHPVRPGVLFIQGIGRKRRAEQQTTRAGK